MFVDELIVLQVTDYMVARGRVQLPTFALGVRYVGCCTRLHVVA
jgi:hypothetical protein